MVIYAVYGSLDLTGLIDELLLPDGNTFFFGHDVRLKINKKSHKREYRKHIYPLIELYTAGLYARYQPFYLFAPEQMEKPLVYASAKLTITPHTTYSLSVTKVNQAHISFDNLHNAFYRFGENMADIAGRMAEAFALPAHLLGRYQQPRELVMPRRVELDEITPETPPEQYPEWLQSVGHRYTVGLDVGIEGDGGNDGDRA